MSTLAVSLRESPRPSRPNWLLGFTGLIPMLLSVPILLLGLWEVGVAMALLAVVAVMGYHLLRGQGVTVLDATSLTFGAANAVLYFGLGSPVLVEHMDAFIYGLLLSQVIYCHIRGEPWTVQFAKRTTPQALWNTAEFLASNQTVSLAWGLCFLLAGLSALVGQPAAVRFGLPVALNLATALATPRIVRLSLRAPRAAAAASVQFATGAELFAAMQARFHAPDAAGVEAVLQFHLTDETPADWYFMISDQGCRLAPGRAAEPTTVISTSARTWLDIASGTLSGAAALMDGRYEVSGDLSLLLRLQQLFPTSRDNDEPSPAASTPLGSQPSTAPNIYLQGNYAPVTDELTSFELAVEGAIPAELNGLYLRNGPNPQPAPTGAYHWFTGDGMVHGIKLHGGRAGWYRNRWVRTERLARRLGPAKPAGPPEVSPIGNPANTHVISHAGRILALCEVGLPYDLTPELETIGRSNFAGQLRGPMTAHPKKDPATGELLFFGYSPFPPYLTFHTLNASGQLTKSVVVEVKGPTMMHDFAITAGHVIFFDLPVVFDVSLAGNRALPYRWSPDYGARLGVMPRDADGSSHVRWFDIERCYVLHSLNAYEENDRLLVDVVRYPKMFARDVDGPFEDSPPSLYRWTIDLSNGTVRQDRLDDRPMEFPRVDERRVGRAHRYGYGVEARGDAPTFGGLQKYDLLSGSTQVHNFGPGRVAGEAVFVPASKTAGEDEGWLLSLVYDAGRNSSDLTILEAGAFAAKPVATVHLPQRVPFGFHGSWVADS